MARRHGPIIVEGPDGSGKTMLAKKLCLDHHKKYRRPSEEILSSSTGPSSSGLFEWWDSELAESYEYLRKGIYDRCTYISDPIYQQAQPKRPLLVSGEHLASGQMTLWNVEPIIIFCLPPFNVQLGNVKASGRDRLEGVDDHQLEKISNAYWACYGMWKNSLFESVILYDYSDGQLGWLLQRLSELGAI